MNAIEPEAWKNLSIHQQDVDELKHLIRKFRWMGLEHEAESACARLSRLAPASTVFTGPHDTD